MKNLIFIFVLFTCSVWAQDTIRFTDGKFNAVKVSEVGLNEIKYNRFDNLTGPMYVVDKSLVRYIKYQNGSVDSFSIAKPKIEQPQTVVSNNETPEYVNNLPTKPAFEKIQIIGKRKLFYEHRNLNDKALFSVIKKHPDQGIQNLMIKEFSKIGLYKNNRTIGLFMMYGGIATSFFAITGAFGRNGNGGAFLLGTAAGITGSIVSIMNKNKRYASRLKIAKLYNGDIINYK